MIPKNISKIEILKALSELDRIGILKSRESRKYHIMLKGKLYPPKLVVSLANKYVNGFELDSKNFGGGAETNNYLKNLGFKIIDNSLQPIKKKIIEHPQEKTQKHSERCKDCKENFYYLLTSIFGEVRENYQLAIGTNLQYCSSHKQYVILKSIFKKLLECWIQVSSATVII